MPGMWTDTTNANANGTAPCADCREETLDDRIITELALLRGAVKRHNQDNGIRFMLQFGILCLIYAKVRK